MAKQQFEVTPNSLLRRQFGEQSARQIVDALELHLRREFFDKGKEGAILFKSGKLVFGTVPKRVKPKPKPT